MEHEIEIFTSGCPLCVEAVEMVERARCPECRVTVYDLVRQCESKICLTKAREYGIKATPSIVIDGKRAFCGKPDPEELRKALG